MITVSCLYDGSRIGPRDIPACGRCRTVARFVVTEHERAPGFVCHAHLGDCLDRADLLAWRARQLGLRPPAELVIESVEFVLDRKVKAAYGQFEYTVIRRAVTATMPLQFF